jgi:hypothetical protein
MLSSSLNQVERNPASVTKIGRQSNGRTSFKRFIKARYTLREVARESG